MISLILTTLNEARSLPALLTDLPMQTRAPDELVIVDAGSTDGTVDAARSLAGALSARGTKVRLEVLPGANIARGRNHAIEIASGPTIAVTDAGCRLDPHWLERIVAPLEAGRADLVAGFFLPVANDSFQQAVARLTTSPTPPAAGSGFLPSSRSIAFTKELWSRVGGYPEWLPWGEDTHYDRVCLAAGARFEIAGDAVVHWEVRPDFTRLAKQYARYSYGDGLAGRVTRSELAIAGTYVASALALPFAGPLAIVPPVLLASAWVLSRRAASAWTFPMTLSVAATIQCSRVVGFIRGCIRRAIGGPALQARAGVQPGEGASRQ